MDIGTLMNVMRDPAGIPSHPVVFQALMIFTWIFHIAFVLMTFGTAGLAIYGFYRRDRGEYWTRLSMAMTKSAKAGVSLLIVLGVAPLLFTQVVYDPQWYTASVLSARWLVVFIFTLIIGYCSWFIFYYSNKEGARHRIGWFAFIGLGLFMLDGLIMHTLAYQSLLPEQWMNWYAPGGVVDTSGATLHGIQWSRFLFIISLSVPAAGLYLMAYADYFKSRPDRERPYLAFARQLGVKLSVVGLCSSLVLFLWWQAELWRESVLATHPVGWLLGVSMLVLLYATVRYGQRAHGYALMGAGMAVLSILAVWREIVRTHYLLPFDYDITNYPVHADWPSTALFFLTFLGVGGSVGGFFVVLLYRAGRVQGMYTADKLVSRMGTLAVVMLALWTVTFFAYGIVIWMSSVFGN